VEADGTGLDFTIYTQFYHCFAEYCLLVGDIAQARTRAMQLHDYAAPAPDRNHLSLAYGLLARIALAAGDREDARAQLARALATLDNANLPLAQWRIYLAAAEIYEALGETDNAAQYRALFEDVIGTLAQNFDAQDPLRASLLAAIETKRAARCTGGSAS
jgi:tetratricopeptide (TPR) repeat protein